MSMSHIHEVTIFPLSSVWQLDPEHAFSTEIDGKTFIQALKMGMESGALKLKPGCYLLLEFSEDLEEFIGMVFSINDQLAVVAGPASARMPRLTTWPPR